MFPLQHQHVAPFFVIALDLFHIVLEPWQHPLALLSAQAHTTCSSISPQSPHCDKFERSFHTLPIIDTRN